jgi:hypothetical protein
MLKHFLVFSLAVPLCGYSQSYADSPFSVASVVPASALPDGYAPGSGHANGVAIDLFVSRSELAIAKMNDHGQINAKVDGSKPAQVFRYYRQYDDLGETFGYDLLAQPVEGTDQIKCTFSQLTDPDPGGPWWPRDKFIRPIALPADLTPIVVRSGQVIAIATYPAGKDKPAVIHYVRLTRMDAAHPTEAQTE